MAHYELLVCVNDALEEEEWMAIGRRLFHSRRHVLWLLITLAMISADLEHNVEIHYTFYLQVKYDTTRIILTRI